VRAKRGHAQLSLFNSISGQGENKPRTEAAVNIWYFSQQAALLCSVFLP
jgi:hypothetical protein